MSKPEDVVGNKARTISFLVVALLRHDVSEHIFRVEAPYKQALGDITTLASFSDLLLALLAKFAGEFVAPLQSFSGHEEIIQANNGHLGLLGHGSVGRSEPPAFYTLFAPRSKGVVVHSVALHLLLAWLRGACSMTSRRNIFVLRIVDLHLSFSQRVLKGSDHSPTPHITDRGALTKSLSVWSYGSGGWVCQAYCF